MGTNAGLTNIVSTRITVIGAEGAVRFVVGRADAGAVTGIGVIALGVGGIATNRTRRE